MKLKNPKLTASLKALAALALAASVTLPARAAYQTSILDQGPLGYWRLTETTPPTAPNLTAANLGSLASAVDGTYAGDQSFFRGVAGAVAGNTAASFDGVANSITTTYNASMNPGTFSFEGWLAPGTLSPPGGLTCALACGTFSDPRSGWLLYQAAANAVTGSNPMGWNLRLYNLNGLNPSLSLVIATNMVVGTYYHVAVTFDGTTARGYVNGVLVASGSPSSYVPGASGGFFIGARSDAGFPWQGKADEVAFYSSVLSASDVAAHYAAATTNAAGYATQIGLSAPLAYYRLGEAGDTTGAANLGSLGSAGNGAYLSTSSPGQPGPRPPTYPNLEAINYGCTFDGTAGYVALPALGTLGNTAAMTAWVNPAAPQTANAGIFFNQGTGSGLRMSADGTQLGYDWNGTASSYASGLTLPVSQWSFVAVIIQPNKAILCLHDGTTFSVRTNTIANGSVTFSGKSRIGSFASTPTTFNGTVDEVTLFNRSLSVGEAYSQYAAAVGGLPPVIFQDPIAPAGTVYAFDTLNLAVDAGGTPDLFYQWRKGTVDIGGANNSTYVIPSLVVGDSGSYDVVVANASGSITSAPASITVNTLTTPSISVHPVGRTNYVGGLIALSVTASGGNLKYQWRKDGSFVAGATASAYTVASAGTNNNGTYTVSVTNTLGALTSSPAIISVLQPVSNSFEGLVVTDGPESWWRLNDLAGSTAVFDGMARHDGNVVGSVTYGATGITASGGNKAASFDGSAGNYLSIPYTPALNVVQYTVECWVNTPDLGVAFSPLSSLSVGSSSAPYHGKGYMILSETGGNWRTGTGQDDQYIYYYVDLGPVVANTWTHLVMTYSSTAGQVYYINGVRVPTSGGYGNFVRNVTEPFLIGSANPGGNLNLFFHGLIDEVAYYSKVLSQAQVQAHYQAGLFGSGTPPTFSVQPQSQTVIVGSNATFSATVGGTTPLGYQWLKNGTPIAGKTTNSLTITNVYYTDSANYQLRATNTAGTNTSAIAALSVVPSPTFVNATNGLVLHLKFDGDYLDSSGRGNNGTPAGVDTGAPSFSVGKIGPKALHYFTLTDLTTPAVTNAGYVTLGAPSDLLFGSAQNFSVSYWVKLPTNYLGGDLPFLCSAPNSYGNFGITFAPSYTAGGWSWFLGNSSSGVGLYGPANSINNGAWHNLVHTFDRAGFGTTYLDGVLVSSILDLTAGDIDSGLDFNIGQDGSGLYPEQGSADVDDVALWRRVLTSYESQSIYIVGSSFGRSFDTFGPVTIKLNKLPNGDLEIIWQAGTLKQADSITGPWTPVPGATAPYLRITPATTGAKFYGVGP